MTTSAALATSRPHLPEFSTWRPQRQIGRIPVPGPGSRASLLLFVGAAHVAALWAISRAPEQLEAAAPIPLAVTFVETARPVAEPQPAPRPRVVTPTNPSQAKQPARRLAPARPKQTLDHAQQEPVVAPSPELVASAPSSSDDAVASQATDASANVPLAKPAHHPVSIAARFDVAYLNNPAPAYPGLARRLGEEGTVRLRVWVTREGRAGKVELSQGSGSPRLDRTALETVSRWRFEPAREDGLAVEQWVIVPIKFKLENRDQ